MSDEATATVEAPEGPMTKESLFPEGLPGTPERVRNFKEAKRREAAEQTEPEPDEGDDEVANLAEAQEDIEQVEEVSTPLEAAGERMRLKDFLTEAGWSMEDFYRDVTIDRDGAEVSVSQAWDDYRTLKEANDTLLRERSELVEKANRAATQVMQPGVSPEAQTLANQAQMKLQQIQETDWSQVEPGHAANMKFDLQAQAQQLWQQAEAKQAEHQGKLQDEARKAMDEAERLTRAAIPEWNDQRVRDTEWRGIEDMLRPYGIQPQEVQTIIDPRWRRVLRDALKTNAEKARIAKGVRKVQRVGKTLPPGARAPVAKTPTLEGAKAQMQKAKEAGMSKSELNKMRLTMELPEIKQGKRRR